MNVTIDPGYAFFKGKEYAEYGDSPSGEDNPPSVDAFLSELVGAAQAAPHMAHLLGRACFYVEQYQKLVKENVEEKPVRCFLNGYSVEFSSSTVTYEEVIEMAELIKESSGKTQSYKEATVTYKLPVPGTEHTQSGMLTPNKTLNLVNGTIINCVRTDSA